MNNEKFPSVFTRSRNASQHSKVIYSKHLAELAPLNAHPASLSGPLGTNGRSGSGTLLVGGPVVVQRSLDRLDVVVRLEGRHELHLLGDSGGSELGGGNGLGAPAVLHGVAEGGLGVSKVGKGGDVEGGHHLVLVLLALNLTRGKKKK